MDSTLARKIGHLQIPLQDVLKATDNFADENIISSIGHFGPAYKGRLLRSGNLIKIAAKRLDPKFWNGHVHFWNEVSVLSDLDHKNVVSIIGFCDEKGEKIIITPSMANGSLLGDLDNPDLTWKQRLKISIGVARALGYLRHDDGRSYGVIHRNINSSTILLDENWEPKLSGFEISIKQSVNRDDRVVLSKPVGTLGYMDPEIKNMKGVTYKSDIYAFGVVLFEILCGRKAFMEDEAHRYLAPLAKCHYENKILEDIIHPSLRNQMHTQSLMKYSEAAYSCLKEDQTHRPDVNNIISQLEITLQLQLGLSPPPLADVPIAGIASPVQSITRNMDSTLARKIGHLQIPLEDVLVATDNFADENIISSIGDFGPAYKGRLLWSGNLIKIAAKRLDPKLRNGHVHFWNEVSMLSDLDHENVISIIGFCDEKGEKIIITPSMANGSLQGDLDNPDLTWKQRLMISIGVARALGYLCHDEGRSYGVIHRNINSSTILLDENWEAKLSGFGMSIKQSVNRADHVIISEPIGTLGYLDQEIKKRKGVTHKSDIYAFGVVLFEILCGRKAFIEEEAANRFLAELAKCHYENNTLEDIIHPYLRSQIYPQSLVKYSEVAYSCLNEDQTHRPDVNDIISRLERTMELELGLEKIEKKGLQHLKISLGVILLTSDNFSERYKSGHSIDIIEYIVERDHFDKEKPSSKEGKNRGELPKIHKNVLIKRFLRTSEKQEEFFFTEIEILTSINHRNIVTPIGFCVEGSEMVLVFEIPTNGYLRDYLTGRREICILTWEKRLKICIDVAHALNYLHYEMEDKKVIIHTNICSWKFELDENWGAKIDDYQTAVFRPSNQEDEAFYQNKVVGTKYYRDPEHEKTGMLTRKSDVYSFGVVLFEILCGKLAIDPNYLKSHEGGLAPLARRNFGTEKLENMIDPIIKDETNKDSLHSFIEIAYQCVAETQDQRPTMKVVVKELEKALSFQVSQEKQGQQQDKNPVVDQKANHEISEEQIQQDKNQVVDELQKEKQVQQDKNQVVDELQKTNHEILEEQVQKDKNQVVNELQKGNHEILRNNFDLKIPLDVIKSATHNFDDTYRFQRDIDGGCMWYRVELNYFHKENHSSVEGKNKSKHLKRHNNTVVIKRYPSRPNFFKEENFWTEIEMLTGVQHQNIAILLGFCAEASELILVIDNFSNGFLRSYLGEVNKMRIFTWEKRLKICIDIAHALNYLHYEMEDQKKIINRDICGENIGLDENWGAKIVNFWLSVFLPPNQEDEALYLNLRLGRTLYRDPEYELTNKLKRESDVYSFGVVLFEILCGRLASDPIYNKEGDGGLAVVARQSLRSRTLEKMIDPIIKEETNENNFVLKRGPNKDSLNTFIEIAIQCVAETQDQRPSMKVVVRELEKALLSQVSHCSN